MRTRVPALLVATMLALLALGGAAAPASAHASLVSTDPTDGAVLPEAPEVISFTFDERVSLVAGSLKVYDAAGVQVETEAASVGTGVTAELPADLADSTYVATWRVVSSDGHPLAGSITFHVGAPSDQLVAPPPSAIDERPLQTATALVQGIGYASLLLAGGLVFFLAWTTRRVHLHDPIRRRLVRLLRIMAAAAVIAAALAVPLAGAYQQGLGLSGVLEPAALDPALISDQLIVLGLHAVGLGLAAVLVGGKASITLIAAAVSAALTVWSPAFVGHTRAYEPVTLLVVTDALHLSAGAVWLGGLVGLVLILPSLSGRSGDAARVLTRFSTMAAALLGVLAVSGTLLGWRTLGSWSGLVQTAYGRLLLAKAGLALIVVAIAAWNRYRLLPQVSAPPHGGNRPASQVLGRAVSMEAMLVIGLLGVTGFLVEQDPRAATSAPPPPAAGALVATATADDLQVSAALDSGTGRQRQLTVQVRNRAGEPAELLDPPEISLRSNDVDLGSVPVTATTTGTYVADVAFPTLGPWEVQISLRADLFTNPVTTLTIEVL